MQSHLFFSNKLENLFDFLKDNLSKTLTHPFAEICVVVPSLAMEQWLKKQLAEAWGICAGLPITFLNRALETAAGIQLTPLLDLTLQIEKEISKIIEEEEGVEWEPLRVYLKAKEKRLLPLCRELASLFHRLSLYGGGRGEASKNEWQIKLWEKVRPLRQQEPLKKIHLHLFSFSHLPRLYLDHLQKLGSYFYHLSPCREFWSDLPTNYEARFLNPTYVEERHPLLVNLGKVGQEMAKRVEESDHLLVIDSYEEPEGSCRLNRLQRELLTLDRDYAPSPDLSIQIYQTPTRHREVEILYENLVHLLTTNRDIAPQDIIVMAPDIVPYIPYIQAHFGKELPYQIWDVPLEKSNSHFEGLFLLLSLEQKRWNAPTLLTLFGHPLFIPCIGWSEEEKEQIKEWIEETGIRWGLDACHRKILLAKKGLASHWEDEGATWREGIGVLVEELAMGHDPKRIDFTQAELLGEWSQVLDNLQVDLKETEDGLKKTMTSWLEYLKQLAEKYFGCSEEVILKFEKLRLAAPSEQTYTFFTLHKLLEEVAKTESVFLNGNQLQSIRFCSMLPMRAIPAQVVYLMGMDEEAFPRNELPSAFKRTTEDYCPSRLDFDRSLFLEALLSARRYFHLSYSDKPSILIEELKPFISAESFVIHPFRRYDTRYFQGLKGGLNNFSVTDYEMAQALQKTKEKKPPFFIPPSPFELPHGKVCIDLTDFQRCFHTPLKYYFQTNKKIQFPFFKAILEEEAFTLSPLKKASLRKVALNHSMEKTLQKAREEKDFPIGMFGQLAEYQIRREWEEITPFSPLEVSYTFSLTPTLQVTLKGTLEGVQQNLYAPIESTLEKTWPLFALLYEMGISDTLSFEGQFYPFSSSSFSIKPFFDYYFLAAHTPLWLYPDWIIPLLKQNSGKIETLIKDQLPYDPALRWVLRRYETPSGEALLESYQPWAEKLYGALYAACC